MTKYRFRVTTLLIYAVIYTLGCQQRQSSLEKSYQNFIAKNDTKYPFLIEETVTYLVEDKETEAQIILYAPSDWSKKILNHLQKQWKLGYMFQPEYKKSEVEKSKTLETHQICQIDVPSSLVYERIPVIKQAIRKFPKDIQKKLKKELILKIVNKPLRLALVPRPVGLCDENDPSVTNSANMSTLLREPVIEVGGELNNQIIYKYLEIELLKFPVSIEDSTKLALKTFESYHSQILPVIRSKTTQIEMLKQLFFTVKISPLVKDIGCMTNIDNNRICNLPVNLSPSDIQKWINKSLKKSNLQLPEKKPL